MTTPPYTPAQSLPPEVAYSTPPANLPPATGMMPAQVFYAAPAPQNGMGIASLVCAIIGFCGGFIPVIGIGVAIVLVILAAIFGAVALTRVKKGQATNKGVAIAGLAIAVIALIAPIIGLIAAGSALAGLAGSLA